MEKIKVLIADSNEVIVKKFCKMVSGLRDIEVLGTAFSGYDAVMEAALLKPDIILMSIEMETPHAGIFAARTILKKFPEIRIIILADRDSGKTIESAIEAGATSYIFKNAELSDVVKTIKDTYKMKTPNCQYIYDKFYYETMHPEGIRDTFMYTLTMVSQLTPRELEITKLLNEGKNCYEIAQVYNTEPEKIKQTVNHILEKFNKKSVGELLRVLRTLDITRVINHIV